jgi:hypothetical protein
MKSSPSHTHEPHKDLALEQAIGDARSRAKKLPNGMVTLVLCKLEGVVAYHRVKVDRLTEEEWERLMQEMPSRVREVRR